LRDPAGGDGQGDRGCGAAIGKAGASSARRAGLDKCAAALVGCAQTKPADAGCLTKAKATCEKLPEDLARPRCGREGTREEVRRHGLFAALDAPTIKRARSRASASKSAWRRSRPSTTTRSA
jgi:hypothetical protein